MPCSFGGLSGKLWVYPTRDDTIRHHPIVVAAPSCEGERQRRHRTLPRSAARDTEELPLRRCWSCRRFTFSPLTDNAEILATVPGCRRIYAWAIFRIAFFMAKGCSGMNRRAPRVAPVLLAFACVWRTGFPAMLTATIPTHITQASGNPLLLSDVNWNT